MKRSGKLVAVCVAGACVLAVGNVIAAPDDRPGPTWAEFQKLQAEVRDQRQLIIQLMQSEQQRYDTLLKLLQMNGGAPAAAAAAAAPPGSPPVAGAPPRGIGPIGEVTARPREAVHATIEGSVKVSGGEAEAIYVYVDNVKGSPVRGKTVQIKQEGKQFMPDYAVVQVGTQIDFPNADSIFHNVFSQSPRNSFDLGAYRAGPAPRKVTMTSPGVVDVQCNMHESMRAEVLVVPNKLFTKVRPDGTFRIEGVPTGSRRVVAWGPNLKPSRQTVDLGASGARADFAVEYTGPKVLPNKLGQPYGSYKE
jgi:plastocyanin